MKEIFFFRYNSHWNIHEHGLTLSFIFAPGVRLVGTLMPASHFLDGGVFASCLSSTNNPVAPLWSLHLGAQIILNPAVLLQLQAAGTKPSGTVFSSSSFSYLVSPEASQGSWAIWLSCVMWSDWNAALCHRVQLVVQIIWIEEFRRCTTGWIDVSACASKLIYTIHASAVVYFELSLSHSRIVKVRVLAFRL